MAKSVKFQASLSGYLAWAWERLLEQTGEEKAEMARMVLRDWTETERAIKYGITIDRWKQETNSNVTRLADQKNAARKTS